MAKQRGATDEQVAALTDFENGPFDEAQKWGLRCAGRIHVGAERVGDEFYAGLKRHYSDPQIIELTAVAAAFEFFTRFVDTLRIPTTPLPERS